MARFDFEELMRKEKADLEKTKLAMEIYQAEDKYAFERNKFKTENLRYILIAVMTSVISLGSAFIIEYFKQKNTARSEAKKEFVDLKKEYLTETDKDKRNELACALSDFDNSLDDISIGIAKSHYATICESSETIKKETETIRNTKSSPEVIEVANQIDEIEKQKQNLKTKSISTTAPNKAAYKTQIDQLNLKIDSLIKSQPSLQSASNASAKIEQQTKNIDNVNQTLSDKVTDFSKSDVVWFKEGYFVYFGEYRVLLQYLDKKLGIQVEVCKTTGPELCQAPLLTKAWIKYGTPLQFSDNNKTFRINLESIDYAGKNPFKLAAYISFESSK